MGTKSRYIAGPTASGVNPGGAPSLQQLAGSFERIDSFNHDLSLLGTLDVGGPMLLVRQMNEYSFATVQSGDRKGSQLILSTGFQPQSHPNPPSNEELFPLGATAIARTLPSAPISSAYTAMRETMSDGFPSAPGVNAWRDRTKLARASGSEYLNVEFGWLPLVSDIKKFSKAVIKHSKILSDYQAGSGNTTRVGFSFPSSSNFSSANGTAFLYFPGNTGFSTVASATYVGLQESEIWFNGAFTYHLPDPGNAVGKAQLYHSYAQKLFGIDPTPEAIWNAAPWSWAADWFGNAGDVLANMSAFGHDSMVLKYGYLMAHTRSEDRITAASGAGFGGHSAGSHTLVREYKKRVQANPYGFGVSDTDLSDTQKAILAAIASSHSGRK